MVITEDLRRIVAGFPEIPARDLACFYLFLVIQR